MTQQKNSNSAQNPEITPEIIRVSQDCDEVVCDGGGGPLGHPNVWYSFDGRDHAACHYCGRKFVKA